MPQLVKRFPYCMTDRFCAGRLPRPRAQPRNLQNRRTLRATKLRGNLLAQVALPESGDRHGASPLATCSGEGDELRGLLLAPRPHDRISTPSLSAK